MHNLLCAGTLPAKSFPKIVEIQVERCPFFFALKFCSKSRHELLVLCLQNLFRKTQKYRRNAAHFFCGWGGMNSPPKFGQTYIDFWLFWRAFGCVFVTFVDPGISTPHFRTILGPKSHFGRILAPFWGFSGVSFRLFFERKGHLFASFFGDPFRRGSGTDFGSKK